MSDTNTHGPSNDGGDDGRYGEILRVPLSDALGERYLSYALSTITARSLPDVRDGLKPVHRRLLFAMQQLKLNPGAGFKKCARVVGDVIGKYHPHGDQAVYDAMVRLAQDFSARYTLVEGQGNFGNIDGDNAAAMRYTEARLTAVAEALLRDIDQDTVDFRPTYDGSEEEPVVLPAAFPNLLANGASGIAVGMATNIPPHNAGQVCDALLHVLDTPGAGMDTLVKKIQGPDFPTGGVVVEPFESLVETYTTGRGGIRLRARWEKEDMGRGQYQIIVTEIPYQVQKSKLIERIADLIVTKKIPVLANVRDESAEDIRLVLEPKSRTIEPEIIMEALFKLTDLEVRFGLNMNVLDANGTPRIMSLRDVLQAFLDHRDVVVVRRSNHRLGKIAHRLEVLEGYLTVFLNLDEVIRIIREEDHPKQELISTFKLTDVQAEAILNMRLRSLRKLEEMELRREKEKLEAERDVLLALVNDPDQRKAHIKDEIRATRDAFGLKTDIGARRTSFADAPDVIDVSMDAMIEKEPITVVCSEKGWIRALKGHQVQPDDIKYKDGDGPKFIITAQTTDKLLILDSKGKFFTIGCDKLPGGRGHGDPVRLLIDLPNDAEVVTLVVHTPGQTEDGDLLVFSAAGRGFKIKETAVMAQTKSGKQILNVGDSRALGCLRISGDSVAVVGDNRKLLVFPTEQVPEMARGQGVILQKYRGGSLSDVKTFTLEDGLSWQLGDKTRTQMDLLPWRGNRAGTGRLPPVGFPKNNKFSND